MNAARPTFFRNLAVAVAIGMFRAEFGAGAVPWSALSRGGPGDAVSLVAFAKNPHWFPPPPEVPVLVPDQNIRKNH